VNGRIDRGVFRQLYANRKEKFRKQREGIIEDINKGDSDERLVPAFNKILRAHGVDEGDLYETIQEKQDAPKMSIKEQRELRLQISQMAAEREQMAREREELEAMRKQGAEQSEPAQGSRRLASVGHRRLPENYGTMSPSEQCLARFHMTRDQQPQVVLEQLMEKINGLN